MRPARGHTKRFTAACLFEAHGALKKELVQHLRSRCSIRRSRNATAKADQRGRILDMVLIRERPGKTLNYETPAERFQACVASTG